MNRDMLKLRKDPTIPPSAAATVNTSTTNAFPVSPRLGGTGGDNRGNRSGRQRTPPKGSGAGNNVASASASSNASVTSTQHPTANGGPAVGGYNTLGSPGYLTGSNGLGIGASGGGGSSAGSPLIAGNGDHSQQDGSGPNGSQSPLQPSTSPISSPNTYKFDTNGALWALSASPDYTRVAVVGRDGNG